MRFVPRFFILPTLLAAFTLITSQARAQDTTAIKQPLHGLVSMGQIGPLLQKGGHGDNTLRDALKHPGIYVGAVIVFSWDELEHTEGKLDSSRIDKALDNVRAYNKSHPKTPLKAKIRIFAGNNVPEWVIAKSGAPMSVSDKRGPMQMGRFWSQPYRDAFHGLQNLLASKYDGDPLMGEVAVSSCATITAEPFIQPLTAENLEKLHAAGFTDAAFKACLLGAVDDYSGWKMTPIDYTVNPFRVSDDGKPKPAPEVTEQVMEAFRKAYGPRAVIANHGLQSPLLDREVGTYNQMKALGPPMEFQAVSPNVNWAGTVDMAIAARATEVEIWDTGVAIVDKQATTGNLERWKAELNESFVKGGY